MMDVWVISMILQKTPALTIEFTSRVWQDLIFESCVVISPRFSLRRSLPLVDRKRRICEANLWRENQREQTKDTFNEIFVSMQRRVIDIGIGCAAKRRQRELIDAGGFLNRLEHAKIYSTSNSIIFKVYLHSNSMGLRHQAQNSTQSRHFDAFLCAGSRDPRPDEISAEKFRENRFLANFYLLACAEMVIMKRREQSP